MNLFKNISIRSKLIFAAVIPVAALLFYLALNINRELRNQAAAQDLISDVALVQKISRVIHELQKERALSLGYVAGYDQQAREQLVDQRENTDRVISDLETRGSGKAGALLDFPAFDSLPAVRMQVNSQTDEEKIAALYYNIKSALLDTVSAILRSNDVVPVKNRLEEHLFLLYTKDFLAQIRSELGGALAAGGFSGEDYGQFATAKGKFEFTLQRFKKMASPELKDFFDRKFQGPFVQQSFAIIDSAYADPASAVRQVQFDSFWTAATSAVNALKEVEDFSGELIGGNAASEQAFAGRQVTVNLLVAVLVVLVVVLVKFLTIRNITVPLAAIRNAADKLATGNVDVSLPASSKDEIGRVADSFNEMIAVTKKHSTTAEAIGMGNYSEDVVVRSEMDTLGLALRRMKENLQKLSKENEARTWLLTGSSELNDTMRGEKDVRVLAQDVITQLSHYLNAQVGAIYLAENGSLRLAGSYAFGRRKENANIYRPGEGLIGQAALEKKPIVFSEVPADYIRIQSGLGNAVPKNIIVYPFLYEGEVKGVIELGTVQPVPALHLDFLATAGENIGIALNASESRTQLKELLEETQRQAEELEAQQEELKQSNEELTEKTELLEKSESELRVQQEELQQTNEELEEKANLLEEQKEKLEAARMDLENKARELETTSRYKSEFLANMSHELRTPLNSVLILAQLLSENKSKSLGEKEVEFAKNIYKSGTDLLNLINEILDLSKVESGKMELDIADVPYEEIRADMESMFSEVARSKSIGFSIRIGEALKGRSVVTDKYRLEQILRNLLSNAFKFTENGGNVSLSVEVGPPSANLRNSKLCELPQVVTFSVADSGIGIPEEKQGMVFEAFQQADGSTKRKYGGTGLGLSISRELAGALGGEIHLQSREGKGSRFSLVLPVKFDESVIIPAERSIEVKSRRPVPAPGVTDAARVQGGAAHDDRDAIRVSDKLILIIEDDADFARTLLAFVQDRNYKGILAYDGNSGLSYARHYKPDAIILDMKLPVMEGTEVLRQLKNDPELRHIPVQIISGYDKRREGMELGAFDFIRKPITREELQKSFIKIESFLSKKLKKLLIVEDNESQNQAISELIGNGDVKCVAAFSGTEALQMLANDAFECIIVDLGLPDMSGFDFLEKIRSSEALKQIPIIVYTGHDLTKAESNRLNKLADTVVLKTVDSHERLLDETALFLHRVESRLPKEKQNIIRRLHKTDEVLKHKKVLVVDDDIRNIYSLTNILEEEGVQCFTAENGRAAVQTLKENPGIDMVLMDVMMPEMDGFEATKEIRSQGQFRKLPIIALTAKAMKGDREKCLNAGMSDYIAKPVNVEQLLSLMRVWLYQ